MNFLEKFHNKNLKHELINKFDYRSTKDLPKLKKIILNFSCKTSELKDLATSIFALELITSQKGILTKSKYPDIRLKIRKGHPIGCKVTLRKKEMFRFLDNTVTTTIPRLKNFQKFRQGIKRKTFSYQIQDTFSFSELGQHYHIFNNISKLDVTIVSSSNMGLETITLLRSSHFPAQ